MSEEFRKILEVAKELVGEQKLKDFYCLLEDLTFYYNDLLKLEPTNEHLQLLQIIEATTEDFLYNKER